MIAPNSRAMLACVSDAPSGRPAVFVDRDGVLVREGPLVVSPQQLELLPGAARAVARLHERGFLVVMVTNQTVVARGLVDETALARVHQRLAEMLLAEVATATLDGIYVCLHHPNATRPEYRVECQCRKPRPGLLLQAQRELGIDLRRSTMVGDRLSDCVAGELAGCRTVLVESEATAAPAIESPLAYDPARVRVDLRCHSLLAFAEQA